MRYFLFLLLLSGCSHYVTPGGGANMAAFGADRAAGNLDDGVRANMDKRPLATFPTAVAMARVQGSGYSSRTASAYGSGRYCVVTTRDVETDQQLARLAKMPKVRGLAPINRLLLPSTLQSDLELRQAAASLHADILLIYTLDTTFTVDDKAAPLTLISVGLLPNHIAHVTCTASSLLMDTRSGHVYGVSEATAKTDQITSGWTSENAIDECRCRAESKAFEKLVVELETTWSGVVAQYAGAPGLTYETR